MTSRLKNFLNQKPFKKKQRQKKKNYYVLDSTILKEYNAARENGPNKILCFAPFKNIYFGHLGKATSCCYGRTYVLGEYPKQSIREIWFGEKLKQLRKSIRNNDLSHGCFLCNDHFKAKNFDITKAGMYDQAPLNTNKYPSIIELELSNKCNLECTMCNGIFSSLIRKTEKKNRLLKICMISDLLSNWRSLYLTCMK